MKIAQIFQKALFFFLKIDDVFVLRLIWVQIYVYEKCFAHKKREEKNLWLCAQILLNIIATYSLSLESLRHFVIMERMNAQRKNIVKMLLYHISLDWLTLVLECRVVITVFDSSFFSRGGKINAAIII